MTLVDTGPLVALADRSDAHHRACIAASARLPAPAVTAWPVVTEALYLLGFSREAQRALLDRLAGDGIRVLDIGRDDLPSIRVLMEKYRSLPMDFADAVLVRLAERERIHRIFTLDRRDFSLYRLPRGRTFDILP